MSEPIRMLPGSDRIIEAVFRDPATGADVPVKITVFQLGEALGSQIGIGFYFTDEAGEPLQGAVLRWLRPYTDPRLIHWQAPHCEHDECGSPCGHDEVTP